MTITTPVGAAVASAVVAVILAMPALCFILQRIREERRDRS